MIYTVEDKDMYEWKTICRKYAKKKNLTLLFVDYCSMGVEDSDGNMRHIYIDELIDELQGR